MKEKRPFLNYSIPVIFIYTAILSVLSLSFSGGLLHILCGFLLYYAIITRMDEKELHLVPLVFIVTAFINIGAMFLQILGIDLIYHPKNPVEAMTMNWPVKCGFMGLNKHLAIFLAIVSGFSYSYCWLFSILIFGIILYLKSLTALIGFLVILLIVVSKKRKVNILPYLFAVLPVIGTAFIFITKTFYKFTVRLEIWSEALKEIFYNIFWGKGLGNFNLNAPVSWANNTKEVIGNSPIFNEYINLIGEFGLIPFLLIAMSVFLYFRKLYLKTKQCNDVKVYFQVIIAILVMCMFQDLLRFARLGGAILVIAAMFELSMITKKEAICV